MLKTACITLAKPKENLFSDSHAEQNRTAQRFQRTNMVLHKKKSVSYIYLHIEIQNFFSTFRIFHNLLALSSLKVRNSMIIIRKEEAKACG